MAKKTARKKAVPAPVANKAPSQEVVPVVKSTALSVDVGPAVIRTLAARLDDVTQAEHLVKSAAQKEYTALATMTQAIVKAAKADRSINLLAYLGEDKAPKNKVGNQLDMCLGLRHSVLVGKPGAERPRLVYVDSMKDYIAPNKDDPTDVAKRKGTLRTNFSTMKTKAAQAAIAIIENDLDVAMDKSAGTLRLTGPAIQKQFGAPSVLLDQKQSVAKLDKKGKPTGDSIALKEKPSFEAIKRMAAEAHGKVVRARVDSRTGTPVDADKALVDLCASLVRSVEKIAGEPSEAVKKALESARSAIDKVLD